MFFKVFVDESNGCRREEERISTLLPDVTARAPGFGTESLNPLRPGTKALDLEIASKKKIFIL